MERNRLSLHQRVDFLLLLLHHREQGDLLFAGVVSGNAVVLLFLLVDLLRNGERINIHRDGVIEQAQIGEALDDAGIGRARPARHHDERVIVPIEKETEIGLAAAFAVPAIFLNRKLGSEAVCRVVVEPVVERGIEKPLVVPEMVGIGHRQHASAARAEDFQQQPVDMLELGLKLVEQRVVVVLSRASGLKLRRNVFQRARDVEDDALPPEFPFRHRLPIAREAFVAGAPGPDVGKALCLLLVAQQLPLVVGIAEVLHLQPLVFVEGRQQETELVLEVVQISNRAIRQVG